MYCSIVDEEHQDGMEQHGLVCGMGPGTACSVKWQWTGHGGPLVMCSGGTDTGMGWWVGLRCHSGVQGCYISSCLLLYDYDMTEVNGHMGPLTDPWLIYADV